MYLLIEVGGYIGTLPTILLVMVTAVIGVALIRRQGLATLTRGMGRLQRGELPVREMVEGLLLAVAGALLLTPGFITDGVGFVLLTPITRALIAERVLANVRVVEATGGAGFRPAASAKSNDFADSRIIEGEFSSSEDAANKDSDPDDSDPNDSHPDDSHPDRAS